MSVQATAYVWRHSRTELAERLVLLALGDHAWPDGTHAFPSVSRIAQYTCLNDRTVQRALRRLEDVGRIARDGIGPRGTISYRLVFFAAADEPFVSSDWGTAQRHPGAEPPPALSPEGAALSPLTPGAAPPEPSKNPEDPKDPLTPASGGMASLGAPRPVTGKRDRDHERYVDELTAYVVSLHPRLGDLTAEEARGYVLRALGQLRADLVHDHRDDQLVVDRVRLLTRQEPEHADQLEAVAA